jgi:hypothetical protein
MHNGIIMNEIGQLARYIAEVSSDSDTANWLAAERVVLSECIRCEECGSYYKPNPGFCTGPCYMSR